jgi:hypothetical protein
LHTVILYNKCIYNLIKIGIVPKLNENYIITHKLLKLVDNLARYCGKSNK